MAFSCQVVESTQLFARLERLGFQDVSAPGLSFEQVRLRRDAVEVIGLRPALGTVAGRSTSP